MSNGDSFAGPPENVEPGRGPGRTLVVLAVSVIGLVLASAALLDQLSGKRVAALPPIEVVSVKDRTIEDGRARLEALGFVVDVKFQANELVKKGVVFGQDPVPGRLLQRGDLVTMLASDGPLGQKVPSLAGQQGYDAADALTANGFTPVLVDVPSETVRPGEVVSSNPEAGARAPAGAEVKINVSSGPAPRIVPAVLNLSVQDALVQIGRAGLAPGKIAKTVRTDLPEGTVISVDPAVGSPIPRESPVDLEVASPKALVQVPFLAGLLATTAKTLLKSSNLGVTVIESPVAEGDPNAGRVLAQGIPPSTGVADGTTVEITVAVATAPVPAVDTTTIVTTTVP